MGHAAIRECDGKFECPDEDQGCPGTKWALCALNEASGKNKLSQQIDFIGCWDEQKGENWESKARQCATTAKLDFSAIDACSTADSGTQLQKDAAEAFKKKFPKRPCGGIFGVPHIEINGVEQATTTYKALLKNLCAT